MTDIQRNKWTEHQFNAYMDYYLSFPSYLRSYKRSFDVLVDYVSKTNFHVDHLAYPILFLARHCMELGFKYNIIYFSLYSGKNDFVWKPTHNLEDLFKAFKFHVEKTFENFKTKYGIIVEEDDKKSFWDLCKEVEKLNTIFHTMDKNSVAFRYPVDKEQNPSFEEDCRINIIDVSELLEKSTTLFFHTSDVFSIYTDMVDHYEETMQDYYMS